MASISFEEDDSMREEDMDEPEPQQEAKTWQEMVPRDAGEVRDISFDAVWALSSCKIDGFGIQQLLHPRTDHFWQSDGPQPHTVTIEFQRKTDISFIMIYLDFKSDESYTPSKIQVQTGSSVLDLEEPIVINFHEPVGWQMIDLREHGHPKRPTRAWMIQLQVIQNHQNGRDTHVRAIRVIGPEKPQYTAMESALLDDDDATPVVQEKLPSTSKLSLNIR